VLETVLEIVITTLRSAGSQPDYHAKALALLRGRQ